MTTQQHALSPQRVTYHIDGGVKLIGDAWGDTQAAPILFLHGGGQTRHAWGRYCTDIGSTRMAHCEPGPAGARRQ